MSRSAPAPTPDQVAAMQRAKKPLSTPFRHWQPTADVARKLVEDAELIIPKRERLVRG
ncbi:MAG: hypothetical protein KKH61_11875 [Gammaproteobacteria bacterium]|nr:hypothetical protein [Gammaproteobacteria bacterium]